MPRRTRTALAALTLASLVTACGSTVQVQGSAAVGQGADGLGSSQQQTPGGTTATGGGATGGGTGALAGTTGTTGALTAGSTGSGTTRTGGSTGGVVPAAGTSGSTGATTTGSAAAPSGSVPAKGRGWDSKNVYFGVVTQNDSQKAFAAFGAKSVDPGDTEAQAQAVADDINAHGGILGRKVQLVFKDVATVDTATHSTETGAAVCTYFAEDHPVVAVLSIVTVMDYQPFRACMAKNKVPLYSASVKAVDNAAANSLAPYFYQAVAVSWDELAPVLISRLKAQGYFAGWNAKLGQAGTGKARVGVLVDGSDTGTRLGKIMKSELARAGFGDAVVYQYADASQGQSASVNYFNGNGVTHVIVTDVELTAFQTSASSQQYKPRYGVSTYNAPYANLEASGLTPAGANNGAVGVGWAPTFDVSEANDPGAGQGARTCLAVMKRKGQSFSGKRLAQAFAFSVCDAMWLTAKGATAGKGFTGQPLAQGIESVAPTYSPATGFSAALTAGRHFVPGSVRDLGWYPDCSCFKYGATKTAL